MVRQASGRGKEYPELKECLKKACKIKVRAGGERLTEGNCLWCIKTLECMYEDCREEPWTPEKCKQLWKKLKQVEPEESSKADYNSLKATLAGIVCVQMGMQPETLQDAIATLNMRDEVKGKEKPSEEKKGIYPILVQAGGGRAWRAVEPATFQQLQTVAMQHGLVSEEFERQLAYYATTWTSKDILEVLAMMPGNRAQKELIQGKLNEEAERWRRQNPQPAGGLTVDQIMGVGQTNQAAAQANMDQARQICLQWVITAIRGVRHMAHRPGNPMLVRQKPNENYEEFAARLLEAVDAEPVTQPIKEYLKVTLSYTNANSECQKHMDRVLGQRVQQASIEEKMQACRDIGGTAYQMQLLAQALRGGKEDGKKSVGKCYNCGRPGHRAKECRQGIICHNCGKRGHIQKNCKQKRRKEQGNMRRGLRVVPSAPPME
uniref:Gag polyprotein n=1 Tax=Caprine arthritis encephalitis virus TaxID=11660 RepID=Q9DKV9_CAEV|nr:gag polyprotein [Caprine arthritis encephalitis virus]